MKLYDVKSFKPSGHTERIGETCETNWFAKLFLYEKISFYNSKRYSYMTGLV